MHSCRSLKKTDREGITLIVMLQKSDHEWFAPNVLDKRVTVRKLLLLLFKKERHEWFTYDLSESLSKMSNLLESVSQLFLFFMPKSEESDSLYKRGTVTELLRSFMTKELEERFTLLYERIALLLTKKEQFTQKTVERIPNPVFSPNPEPDCDRMGETFMFTCVILYTSLNNILHMSRKYR